MTPYREVHNRPRFSVVADICTSAYLAARLSAVSNVVMKCPTA